MRGRLRGRRDATRAFLCYEQGDRRLAVRLASDLRHALGDADTVWYSANPKFPKEQAQYDDVMRQMLARPYFLVLVTRRAMRSEWLRQQIVAARDNGKIIVLILRQPVALTDELAHLRHEADAVSALPGTRFEAVSRAIAALMRSERPASIETADAIHARYRHRRMTRRYILTALAIAILIISLVVGPTVVAHATPIVNDTYGCDMPLHLSFGGEHDLGSAQWWPAGTLPFTLQGNSAITLHNGQVLVEGGSYSQGYSNDFSRTSELFDPTTCTWHSAGTLHQGRTSDATVLLRNGKVLAIGGYAGPVLTDVEVYDPTTGVWSPTESMTQPRDLMTATLLPDGRVLVVGGWDNVIVSSAVIYDPSTGHWSSAGDMSIPRTGHVAVVLPSGNVLIAGGEPVNVSTTDRAELYHPATNSWSETGSMTVPRAGAGAVLLPNGKVLIAGGDTTTPSQALVPTATTELYDPATGKWTIAASMHHARVFSHQALELLPNGTALAVGGDAQGTSEIYSPATNTWSEPISIGQAHCDGATALLSDGRVLVVGGYNCRSLDERPLAAMIYAN